MSSASLAQGHRAHPDSARIAAISVAISLNLVVLVIATRPITEIHIPSLVIPTSVPQIRLIQPPAKVEPPIETVVKSKPHHASISHSPPRHVTQVKPVVVATALGSVAATPVQIPTVAPVSDAGTPVDSMPVEAAPVEASLAYRSAPLTFPRQALRQHMQGTVLLRVLVDRSGKPVQVQVEHGSGYALLDRSAREQVLASWRFEPAMINGQTVRAWARVPVNFSLK